MPGVKLRAKTGCFTCRQRRVKCDEKRPSCRNCARFGRNCAWPGASDMSDRRSRSRDLPRAGEINDENTRCDNPQSALTQHSGPKVAPACILPLTSKFSGIYNMAYPLFQSSTEHELIHYFLNFFFQSLTLPTRDDTYYSQSLWELMNMMAQNDIVKHSVLASCASNKHVMTGNDRHRLLGLQYYSRAVKEMNQELASFRSDNPIQHSCLLTAVSFFYIFGFWGIDASSDPRPHVDGAVKLLTMKSHDQAANSSTRTYDRVNIESVLYQGFLLATRRPFKPDFHMDPEFISHAESLLNQCGSSDSSGTNSSLILGVPTSLYRLILKIMDSYSVARDKVNDYLGCLRVDMDYWEQLLINDDIQDSPPSGAGFNDLMILAASLLLDLVAENLNHHITISEQQKPWRWQMDLAMAILQCPEEHEKWSHCFLGAWPLLILGYGARSIEEITLVKDVLGNIRQRTGYGEVQRIREELEGITSLKSAKEFYDST
ncbi:hypothetical protein LB507_010235 [Fusarium sp. FIESC RH6]|nr:hypothetical protein LB507_010235 [Fusarium sp. FIESC RH6]